MRWRFWQNQTEQRAGFTESAIDRMVGTASGGLAEMAAAETACAEACVSLYARAFAVAEIQPDIAVLDAPTRAAIARRLLLSGNAVYALAVDARGRLSIAPASSYDITGGSNPDTWRYRLELSGPSRNETRQLAGASVLHFRINADAQTPWRGCSPLEAAGISSRMLARLETRMSQEAGARVGYMMEVPSGASDDSLDSLRNDLASMKGNVGLIESAQGGYDGESASWGEPMRFGASIPVGNVEALKHVASTIFGVFGVPPGLFLRSDGTAMREAYRQLLAAGIAPIAEIVAAEISEKLETDIEFKFGRLAAQDVAGRARAFGILVEKGIDNDTALGLAGLDQ